MATDKKDTTSLFWLHRDLSQITNNDIPSLQLIETARSAYSDAACQVVQAHAIMREAVHELRHKHSVLGQCTLMTAAVRGLPVSVQELWRTWTDDSTDGV